MSAITISSINTPEDSPDQPHTAKLAFTTPSNFLCSAHFDPIHSKHAFDITALKSCYYASCNNCLQSWRKSYAAVQNTIPQHWVPGALQYGDATVEQNDTITCCLGDGVERDEVALEHSTRDRELEANGYVENEGKYKDSILSSPCNANGNMCGLPILPVKTGAHDFLASLETTIRTIDDWSNECQDYDAFDDYVGDRVSKMDPGDTVEFSRGLRVFLASGPVPKALVCQSS